MSELKARPLFNPDGDQDVMLRRIIGGNPTNLQTYNRMKYNWASGWYRTSMNNFWIPEEIPMAQDVTDYRNMKPEYKESTDMTLSFLIYLDSLQTSNLPNINDYITAPEVNLCLTLQTSDEAIHSQSYSYILDSICHPQEADAIQHMWRDHPLLRKRTDFIGGLYNEFNENPSEFGLVKTCMANFILEGIYFYSGFAFFYSLGREGIMGGTVKEIKYINRDELTHIVLFMRILSEMRKENPHLFSPSRIEILRDMMRAAVETEIEWGKYIIGDRIESLNETLVERYIKHLSNERMRMIGFEILYPEITEDPLPWIKKMSTINGAKTDFFEQKVTAYSKGAAVKNDL